MTKYFDIQGEIGKIAFDGKYYSHVLTNTYTEKIKVITELNEIADKTFKAICKRYEHLFWVWFNGLSAIILVIALLVQVATFDFTWMFVLNLTFFIINTIIAVYSYLGYYRAKEFLSFYYL